MNGRAAWLLLAFGGIGAIGFLAYQVMKTRTDANRLAGDARGLTNLANSVDTLLERGGVNDWIDGL